MKIKIENKKKQKKLECGFTLCIHNTSCCVTPVLDKKTYCRIAIDEKEVGLKINKDCKENDDTKYMSCNKFILNENKTAKCVDCQVKEYGEISIPLINMEINYSNLKENIEDMIEDGDDFFDE